MSNGVDTDFQTDVYNARSHIGNRPRISALYAAFLQVIPSFISNHAANIRLNTQGIHGFTVDLIDADKDFIAYSIPLMRIANPIKR